MSMTDPDRGLPHAHPQRDPRLPRDRADARLAAEGRACADPRRAGLHRRLERRRGRPTRPATCSRSGCATTTTAARRSPACAASRARPAHVRRRRAHPSVQGGMGTAIVSTSSGVMTGHEARARASAAKSSRRSGECRASAEHRFPSRAASRSRSSRSSCASTARAARSPSGSRVTSRCARRTTSCSSRARPTAASIARCTASSARSWPTW